MHHRQFDPLPNWGESVKRLNQLRFSDSIICNKNDF